MKDLLGNHLILDRVLATLPLADLNEARLVCHSWDHASRPHLQNTFYFEPVHLLFMDPERLRARCRFLGTIGQVRLLLSNEEPDPDVLQSYQTEDGRAIDLASSINPWTTFIEELLPLFGHVVTVLRVEMNLASDEDLDQLLKLFRFVPSVRRLCFGITSMTKPILRKFAESFKNKGLLPKLTQLYPTFDMPVPIVDENWKKELIAFLSAFGEQVEDLSVGSPRGPLPGNSAVPLLHENCSNVTKHFKKLKGFEALYGLDGTEQLLQIKQPLSRLYLGISSCIDLRGFISVLSHFSDSLTLLDVEWEVYWFEPNAQRLPFPTLPNLKVLSLNVSLFSRPGRDREFGPPLNGFRDKRIRGISNPEMMMDPFQIKETVFQGGCSELPKLESLYLLYPHIQGEDVWDYFFPLERSTKVVPNFRLKKLVISKVKHKDAAEWRRFRDERVKRILPKLERLRYFKKTEGPKRDEKKQSKLRQIFNSFSRIIRGRNLTDCSVFYIPEETYFPGNGKVIDWESRNRGVWIQYREFDDFMEMRFMMQYSLRNSSFHNAFIAYNAETESYQ